MRSLIGWNAVVDVEERDRVTRELGAFLQNDALTASDLDQTDRREALIDELVQTAKVPSSHAFSGKDPSYEKKKPLFRRMSAKARVTLFDGGHELVSGAALAWLSKQRK